MNNREIVSKKFDENVKYTLKGENGQLYVYDNKIEISRKGICAFFYQGLKGTKTIPISEIKNIQMKQAGVLFVGYIQFAVGGGIESRIGITGAQSDENTITFYKKHNKQVLDIKNYIESIMLNKEIDQKQTLHSTYIAEELRKFKELLDEGIITQEEFEDKKKQLLYF